MSVLRIDRVLPLDRALAVSGRFLLLLYIVCKTDAASYGLVTWASEFASIYLHCFLPELNTCFVHRLADCGFVAVRAAVVQPDGVRMGEDDRRL